MSRGNRFWSIGYALTSIRNRPLKSMGIALLLSIGVALPTSVFAWSATAEYVTFETYFSENAYQMLLKPPEYNQPNLALLKEASDYTETSYLVEAADLSISTVAVVVGPGIPNFRFYDVLTPMEAQGMEDTRVIPVSEESFEWIKGEFVWMGNSTLTSEQIAVSSKFLQHCALAMNIDYTIGDQISIDIITKPEFRANRFQKESYKPIRLENVTIAGIYDPLKLNTLLGDAHQSIMRDNTWTSYPEDNMPVLGLSDSIFILDELLNSSTLERIEIEGWFAPKVLVRANFERLLDAGSGKTEESLLSIRELLHERYPDVLVKSVGELEALTNYIDLHLRNHTFTLLGFPIIIMSLFLTIFTSKSSIIKREDEVSILRSKGASYNQVLASIIWEAVILALISLVTGMLLSFLIVPTMGGAVGTFMIDPSEFVLYFTRIRFPAISIFIAGVIAFYLPGLYLYHVNMHVKVDEIGQPIAKSIPEEIKEEKLWKFTSIFVLLLLLVSFLPSVYTPSGISAALEVMVLTFTLFIASYTGSIMMQQIVSRFSKYLNVWTGEISLYVAQSLQRRRGQFIPLLVVLMLTLSTITIAIMESSTIDTTTRNELEYAYGADIRIDTYNGKNFLSFREELESYEWIKSCTAVASVNAKLGSENFRALGIDPTEYKEICNIGSASFNSGNATYTLNELNLNQNGIIISEYHGELLNLSVGGIIWVSIYDGEAFRSCGFKIVGFMKSAPGFGVAAQTEFQAGSLSAQLGTQIGPGSFVFMNQRYLLSKANITKARYFFADSYLDPSLPQFCEALQSRYEMKVDTCRYSTIFQESNDASLFLRGLQGFTTISIIMCTIMGLAAIGFFFGSAITERKPEYAILKAIGGTTKQVSTVVLGEFASVIVAITCVSLLMGLFFGYAMSILIFTISPLQTLLPIVQSANIGIILAISLAELIVMLIACFHSSKTAGTTNMLQELRNL